MILEGYGPAEIGLYLFGAAPLYLRNRSDSVNFQESELGYVHKLIILAP